MADIAKCNDVLCPSKDKCYRFTAPASKFMQSYLISERESDAVNCDMFWDNDKCKYCGLERGNHKMGCETRRVKINL